MSWLALAQQREPVTKSIQRVPEINKHHVNICQIAKCSIEACSINGWSSSSSLLLLELSELLELFELLELSELGAGFSCKITNAFSWKWNSWFDWLQAAMATGALGVCFSYKLTFSWKWNRFDWLQASMATTGALVGTASCSRSSSSEESWQWMTELLQNFVELFSTSKQHSWNGMESQHSKAMWSQNVDCLTRNKGIIYIYITVPWLPGKQIPQFRYCLPARLILDAQAARAIFDAQQNFSITKENVNYKETYRV